MAHVDPIHGETVAADILVGDDARAAPGASLPRSLSVFSGVRRSRSLDRTRHPGVVQQ
jgi:hypothetical protein